VPGFFVRQLPDWIAIAALQKKVGRSWHHHSRALRRQSMGQGDDRLPEKCTGPGIVPGAMNFF
jgi:hypothetical protein